MNADLASWVPAPLLAGMLWLLLRKFFADFERRFSLLELGMSSIKDALAEQEKRSVGLATVEQLGHMGDRFDGRITGLAQDIAVLKARAEWSK